jgi:hypothetical protein
MDAALQPLVLDQPGRHLVRRQHPVDHAGRDRRARHAAVHRLARVLRDRQAAAFLDALDADRAVAVGPR